MQLIPLTSAAEQFSAALQIVRCCERYVIIMNQYAAEWFELEFIFGSATKREQSVDNRANVNWDDLEQITLGGAVAAGCALLEKAKLKGTNQHVKIIFELRNAFIHNGCDISKNNDKSAFLDASNYLTNKEYSSLSPDMSTPYFSLDGSIVEFNEGILFAIRLCLI